MIGHALLGKEHRLPPSITRGTIATVVKHERVPVLLQVQIVYAIYFLWKKKRMPNRSTPTSGHQRSSTIISLSFFHSVSPSLFHSVSMSLCLTETETDFLRHNLTSLPFPISHSCYSFSRIPAQIVTFPISMIFLSQSTCAVHSGASGGPLVDERGALLGIVVCNAKWVNFIYRANCI